jgi:hypothetical protein
MTSTDRPADRGPLAGTLAALCEWLTSELGADLPVRVAPPSGDDAAGLSVWPLALLADQDTRGGSAVQPLRLRARYLLTAGGPPEAATRILDTVLAAAVRADTYHVVFDAVPAEVWLAAAVPPRAALQFDVVVQVRRDTPARRRVREPLLVEFEPLRAIAGRVLGPGGMPVVDIEVAVDGGGSSTRTDERGAFRLAAVPATATALVLSGKGLRLRAEISPGVDEPVVIHCEIEEV